MIMIQEIAILKQLLHYLSSPTSTPCPGSNGSRVAICSITKIFLTFGFSHCLFSQTTLYSDMGVAIDFLIWAKLCEVVDSSEGLKKKIHYEVVQSKIYHQCNVWVIIFLKQALNDFHGSFYFPVTSKDSVGCLSCGLNHIWLQIACIQGMNMRFYRPIQLLEAPMPNEIDFVRDYLRRLPIQFTYLNIPGVIIMPNELSMHYQLVVAWAGPWRDLPVSLKVTPSSFQKYSSEIAVTPTTPVSILTWNGFTFNSNSIIHWSCLPCVDIILIVPRKGSLLTVSVLLLNL